MKTTWLCCALAAGLQLTGLPAQAVDLSWSGFGTLGYAQTNRPYTYQRFLRDEGSFERDTVLGGQVDAQFTPQWSATVQVTLAPSVRNDKGWSFEPTWAFVAWRPEDDWLLRVGRLRLPFYLHSESLDVGQTHDMVRLPTEMYSIVPTNFYDGLSLTKTWAHGDAGEVSLDLYHGQANSTARLWNRDGLPPVLPAGANFVGIKARSTGLVLTWREPNLTLRAGAHYTRARPANGQPWVTSPPYVTLAPGLGYYQVDAALPGPGVSTVSAFHNTILTLGAEHTFGDGWTVAGELARNIQHDIELGSDTLGGYLMVSRRVGHFTPYTSVSALRSPKGAREWVDRLTNQPLPAFIPGADMINAAQRAAAEGTYTTDQRSFAVGSSYNLTPSSKLKAEWMRTRVGLVSRMVDTPAGSPTIRDTHIDVLSINYNFVF